MTRRVLALAATGLTLLAVAGCGGSATAPAVPKAQTLAGRTDHLDGELRGALLALKWPHGAQGLDGAAPVPTGSTVARCTAKGTGRNADQLSVTVAITQAKELDAKAPGLLSYLTAHGWKTSALKADGSVKTAQATKGDEKLSVTDGLAQLFLLGFTPCAPGTPVTQNATPTMLKLVVG
ncbi:hypothetical protein POF50_026990 [Streptomyces sp. SL13]|uniref:LytR family transcriptional regulator n=1 Tax=Streptantibioticus silvisoli TaxID=2705255 RepID=A0AA90H9S6_9ACTN|nr:hypothetical protein [Streptantibioticus silvisoli]MDI5965267.1 hypothetical protein [Streptantibioticus silvisoli]MDI5972949.1 hypothetical protein [Streptantibioticus silvisoli]